MGVFFLQHRRKCENVNFSSFRSEQREPERVHEDYMNINDRTINAIQSETASFHQSENAALTYTINYAALLQTATISASEWSTTGSVSIASEANTDTTTSAKLSGSTGRYRVVNKITTSAGEIIERIISLTITRNDCGAVFGDYN